MAEDIGAPITKPSHLERGRFCPLPLRDTVKVPEGHKRCMEVMVNLKMSFSKQQQPTNNLPDMKLHNILVHPMSFMGSHLTKLAQGRAGRNLVEELEA